MADGERKHCHPFAGQQNRNRRYGGNAPSSPPTTTAYTLTATNAAGSITRTLSIGVNITLLPPELTNSRPTAAHATMRTTPHRTG